MNNWMSSVCLLFATANHSPLALEREIFEPATHPTPPHPYFLYNQNLLNLPCSVSIQREMHLFERVA